MELRQLKYFLAVADARSFVRAAGNLFISRQAVSKSIAQLEEELNVELFMRDSNGAFLTPAGILFYERVRNSVLELEQLQSDIQEYGSHFHQIIRVAFSIGTLQVYEARLQEFIRTQSKIVVQYFECTPDACETLLREHKVDLVITSRRLDDPMFLSHPLAQSPYGILLKEQEELRDLEYVDVQDLYWLPLGGFLDGQTELMCAQSGLTMQYTGIDLLRLASIAADGQCAVIMPKCLVPSKVFDLRWIPLQLSQRWSIFQVYLRSMENNTLYHSALDELLTWVFDNRPDERSHTV